LFVAAAGASAALAGLVVVAISINIERILKYPGLPERGLVTLLLLLGVLVVSLLLLEPGLSRTAVGIELLVEGVVITATVATLTLLSRPRDDEESYLASALLLAAIGTVPFVVAGVSFLAHSGGGMTWVLTGFIAAIVGAMINAWVLLVEILR
jgi:modulator of FtsH protease